MSKLYNYFPVLQSLIADQSPIAHFNIEKRTARNGKRYHLDNPVKDERSGSKGRTVKTDNRYPVIRHSDSIILDDKVLSHASDEVEMFRVKVNDKGNYMVDIILKDEGEKRDIYHSASGQIGPTK